MAQPIRKTRDYNIFKKHENNRAIDKTNLNRLMFSISAQNMLEFQPILVDGQMRIIDGQHRLEAAKLLGIEVYYQVNEETTHQDIVLLNAYQKQWKTEDYINYYISLGNENYRKLQEAADRRSISITELLEVAKATNNSSKGESLKNGSFTFFGDKEMEKIDDILDKLEKVYETIGRYVAEAKPIMTSHRLRRALCAILNRPETNFEVLIQKLTLRAEHIRMCTTYVAYYSLLRDIYNWKNQKPIE